MTSIVSGSFWRPFLMPFRRGNDRILRIGFYVLPFFLAVILTLQLAVAHHVFAHSTTHSFTPLTTSQSGQSNGASAATKTVASTQQCKTPAYNPNPAALPISAAQNRLVQQTGDDSTYTIYGTNGQAVATQIARCSPVHEDGETFGATTDYTINWSFDYAGDGKTCHITNAAVGVHVSQTYPNWVGPSSDDSYDSRWQQFIANLHMHENGHRDLDISYAAQLQRDLAALSGVTCDTIAASANALGNASIDALNQANKAYDARTHHGQSQGATIPL